MQPQSQPSTTCSICKSDLLIITDPDSGEIICSKCGMIVLDKVQNINQPEWHAFSNEEQEDRSRTGIPASLAIHDMGLSTVIGRTDRDASGKKIDTAMHTTMQRLRTWDSRALIHASSDIGLMHAFNKLDILKDKLGLSDRLIERIAYMYRKIQERGLTRGRTISAILSAAIYIACREIGIPRTLKDIAAASNVKRKDIAKNCRLIIRELDLKVPMADPMKCIIKIANKANLSEKITRQAMNMMTEIIKSKISAGKNPMSFAATVLYISSFKVGEKNVTQLDVATAAGVTEVTIRNRIKELNNLVVDITA